MSTKEKYYTNQELDVGFVFDEPRPEKVEKPVFGAKINDWTFEFNYDYHGRLSHAESKVTVDIEGSTWTKRVTRMTVIFDGKVVVPTAQEIETALEYLMKWAEDIKPYNKYQNDLRNWEGIRLNPRS